MKILPNLTSESKWYTQFAKRLPHFKWIKETTFDDVKYLYDKNEDPERAAITYISDRYNKYES